MSEITIRTIDVKKELNTFLKMAWDIYKDDPNWVPPLLYDKKKLLNPKKNPFFKHAEMEFFLAYKENKIVGRIAAIKNDNHNKTHNDKIGFFGFYESINDQEVANKLLDTAKEWLKSKGFDTMRGPANPSSNDEYGLLFEGFDEPARLLMTYNPAYYIDLFDNYGLKKAKDLFAIKIENKKLKQSEKLFRGSELVKRRTGLTIRPLNMKKFNDELALFKEIYNAAWASNWGFVPLTDEEIDAMAEDLKPLVDPNLVLFGEINGKVVCAALVMPDYNYIFKQMNGRLLPFNFIKLFTQNKKIDWARVLTLGVIPEFRGKGIDAVLYVEIMQRAEQRGIMYGEASWILEDNTMMIRGAEAMNGSVYKKYRVYDISI